MVGGSYNHCLAAVLPLEQGQRNNTVTIAVCPHLHLRDEWEIVLRSAAHGNVCSKLPNNISYLSLHHCVGEMLVWEEVEVRDVMCRFELVRMNSRPCEILGGGLSSQQMTEDNTTREKEKRGARQTRGRGGVGNSAATCVTAS